MSYGTKRSPQKNKRAAEDGASLPRLFQSAAIGGGAALLCAALMLFLGAMICLRSEDPNQMILPWGLGTLYLSALLGGIISVRRHGGSALLCGSVCGILLLIFFWILSIFFQENDTFSLPISLLLRALTVLFSLLGGYLGLKRTRRTPHRKR